MFETISPKISGVDFFDFFQKRSAVALAMDADTGSIVFANDAACAYYGYAQDIITTLNISDINVSTPPEMCEKYSFFRHKKANGETRDVEAYSIPLDSFERPTLFFIIHDITDRVEAQKSLRELNQTLSETIKKQSQNLTELEVKFQSVFEYSGIGILLLDRRGVIVDANPAYCNMIDAKKETIVDKKLQNFFDGEDTGQKVEEVLHSGFDFVQFEKKLLSKDGKVAVNITLSPVRRDESAIEYILCIIENISYKKSLEQKQQEQEIMLIQQSKMAAMGEMIGAIAHQWRQPLNALAIIVQDFKSAYDYGELNGRYIDDSVKKSMNQITFMSNTIDSFRNFFKPSKEIEKFLAYDAVLSVCELVETGFRHNGIDIFIDFSKEARLAKITGYQNEFKQAALNILSNSKDAIAQNKNGGWIKITGELLDGRFLSLKFEDNGGGMAKGVIERAFEPYFTTKEPGKGTGIGLYMTKTIIEGHMGCSITASNTANGALFEIVCYKNIEIEGGN